MSYKESGAVCDWCSNAIEDGESMACKGCMENNEQEIQNLKNRIEELNETIFELENRIEELETKIL